MASALGCASASASGCWAQFRERNFGKCKNKKGFKVSCINSSAVFDSYKTLRIQPGASESEVKKAFRQLALQYHPDVCRESNSKIKFHQINEAYDIVMSDLREETSTPEMEMSYDEDEHMRGMNDQDWDLWEEWMGWEGAGIRDYSSHINPYI